MEEERPEMEEERPLVDRPFGEEARLCHLAKRHYEPIHWLTNDS